MNHWITRLYMLSQAAISEVYYSAEHAATNKNKETTKTDNSCLNVFQSPRLDSHLLFRRTNLDKFKGIEDSTCTLAAGTSTVRVQRLGSVRLIDNKDRRAIRLELDY
jgi:GH15 family glucan-1,4-alpha-glucosidase